MGLLKKVHCSEVPLLFSITSFVPLIVAAGTPVVSRHHVALLMQQLNEGGFTEGPEVYMGLHSLLHRKQLAAVVQLSPTSRGLFTALTGPGHQGVRRSLVLSLVAPDVQVEPISSCE